MKVQLTSKHRMCIPLTKEYCQHSATPMVKVRTRHWPSGTQDVDAIKPKEVFVDVCPSLDLEPGVPSRELHAAILDLPQVATAIKHRLIRKKTVQ